MKEIIIKLTKAEVGYLLDLVWDNIDAGGYWGRRDSFMNRQEKVCKKLSEGLGGVK